MKLKWHFPPTCGGISHGFKSGDEEHFRDNAWDHIIRELIQNSLDAVNLPQDELVKIEISEMSIPASVIGAKELSGHMKSVLELTKDENDNAFYKNALELLKQSKIRTLAVIDSNTTGLVDEKWDALVYTEGIPNKSGGAPGGSYGIGKSAPYLASALKTLCYSTCYYDDSKNKKERFIARCKIAAHKNPQKPHVELQHIGFGSHSQQQPDVRVEPIEGNDIQNQFRLKSTGTGIFIIGFDPTVRDWNKVARKSIAKNFFMAINDKKLAINIQGNIINHNTLNEIFEKELKKDSMYHYYKIISNSNKKIQIIGKFGKFLVQIHVGDENLPNGICYINRRGMVITHERSFKKNPFHNRSLGAGWAKYAAVIMADDDKTDEKIRKMEPPNHESIEYERINDEKERASMGEELREIQNKITKIIENAMGIDNRDKEIVLEELLDILSIPGGNAGIKSHGDNLGDENRNLEHHMIKSKPTGVDSVSNDTNGNGGGKKNGKKGRKKSKNGNRRGIRGISGSDSSSSHNFKQQRIIRNNDKLRIAFTPGKNHSKQICFSIRPVGEDPRKEESLDVSQAQIISSNSSITHRTPKSITVDVAKPDRIIIDLPMQKNQSYTGYKIIEFDTTPKSNGEKN